MSTESIFTIIAILLTVFTLIPGEQKKLINLKFTAGEKVISILLWIFIIYLVFLFDHFVEWFSVFNIFIWNKGLTAEEYAFIFSLIFILFLGYKVLLSNFPKANRAKLIEYYKYLARLEKYPLLFELISKYETDFQKRILDRPEKITEELKLNLGLLSTILDNKTVESFTRLDPYYYTQYIYKEDNQLTTDAIQHYYFVLISNPSSQLIREIIDNKNSNSIDENNTLLMSIIGDPQLAAAYRIYQPIGNYCKALIHEEKQKGALSLYNQPYYNTSVLWTLPITHCVHFFNLMITEVVVQKHTDFLWLNYYERFVEMLCQNIDLSLLQEEEIDSEFPTYNHKIIDDIIDNSLQWLNLVNEHYFDKSIAPSILTSLNRSASYIANSLNINISQDFRISQLTAIIDVYFGVNDEIQKQYVQTFVNDFSPKSTRFLDLYAKAWEKLVDDKWAENPFSHEIPTIKDFVINLIEKLKIQTRFDKSWIESTKYLP